MLRWIYMKKQKYQFLALRQPKTNNTSSSAVAERPRDALCMSVVSFNSKIRRTQASIYWWLRIQIYRCVVRTIKLCTVLFGVVFHVGCDEQHSMMSDGLCGKRRYVVTGINYCTVDRYRATRMHSAYYAVARCLSVCLSVRLSVCPSHAGIECKRLYKASNFFHHRLAPPF